MSIVPRVIDITGKKSQEELAAEREWQRQRQNFQDDKAKFGYGTPGGKDAWKRRIGQTRSF